MACIMLYIIALIICCSRSANCFIAKSGIFRFSAFSKSGTASLSSKSASYSKLPHPLHEFNGLLSGISNITSAEYYSNNIQLEKAVQLVKNNRVLYDIVSQECAFNLNNIDEYLESILDKLDIFMGKNKVFDRAELIDGLENASETTGNFVCLLGGKSTGKSLVLKEFAQEEKSNKNVFYVDMRIGYSSITYGFISVIKMSKNARLKELILTLLKTALASKVKLLGDHFELDFNSFLDLVSKEPDPTIVLESLLNGMAGESKVITLVVDEANLPLTIDSETSTADIKQVKATLALFTRMTKQEKKINVILVSSDHVFPFRLTEPKLGFNLKDINKFIFAGEVPPNKMFNLLTQEWELSDNLALSIISLYGGHIWDVYQALIKLKNRKEDFILFDSNLSANIDNCFDDCTNKEEMIRILRLLAQNGFYPLEKRNDPIAEVISRHNVGGVVTERALNIGLPKSAWYDGYKFGLVPASQSMRLVIAEYLHDKKYL